MQSKITYRISSHQSKLSFITGMPLLSAPPSQPSISFKLQLRQRIGALSSLFCLWECSPLSINLSFACYLCAFCPNRCSVFQKLGTLTINKCPDFSLDGITTNLFQSPFPLTLLPLPYQGTWYTAAVVHC
jgi:hypothetical protein